MASAPHLHYPVILIPQGDGTYLVKPGRPVERLTIAQFADRIGLSRPSIQRYLGSACLPERFLEYAGERCITIDAQAVDHFLTYWRRQRDGGIPTAQS
jgi:AcrR family transcriptional regulator